MIMTVPSNSYSSTWTKINLGIAQVLLWIVFVFLPFSHFIVNQVIALCAVFVFISGDYRRKWLRLKQYRSIVWIVLFVFLMGLSICYSSADFTDAFSIFNKYTKLLYIIPLLYVCQSGRCRRISMNVFIASNVIATLYTLLAHISIVTPVLTAMVAHFPRIFSQINTSVGFFVNPINVSVLDAFVMYLLLVRILKRESRPLAIFCFILITLHLFYLNGERTGCFGAILLSYLFVWQYFPINTVRTSLIALLVFIIALLLMATSGVMSHKLFNARHEIKYFSSLNFASGTVVTTHPANEVSQKLGSIGLRLAFINGSLTLIRQHPWLGTGVGSFPGEYNRIQGVMMPQSTQLNEPHNEFLFIAVQLGLIGFLFFFILCMKLLQDISQLPLNEKKIGYALGLLFVFNSLVNATISANTVGLLYVIVTAVLFSSLKSLKRIQQ